MSLRIKHEWIGTPSAFYMIDIRFCCLLEECGRRSDVESVSVNRIMTGRASSYYVALVERARTLPIVDIGTLNVVLLFWNCFRQGCGLSPTVPPAVGLSYACQGKQTSKTLPRVLSNDVSSPRRRVRWIQVPGEKGFVQAGTVTIAAL